MGRPKKIVTDAEPAKKRGRPKKIIETYYILNEPVASDIVAKKRGRPKKIADLSPVLKNEVEPFEEETEQVIKRGRPKKIAEIKPTLLNERPANNETFSEQVVEFAFSRGYRNIAVRINESWIHDGLWEGTMRFNDDLAKRFITANIDSGEMVAEIFKGVIRALTKRIKDD